MSLSPATFSSFSFGTLSFLWPQPPHQASFDAKEQWLYSELPADVRTLCLNPNAEPRHLTEKIHFGNSHPQSFSFVHYTKLITIGGSWNIDPTTFVIWLSILLVKSQWSCAMPKLHLLNRTDFLKI